MIFGVGLDTLQIPRMEKLFENFGNRFLKKFFTEEEVRVSAKFNDNNHKRICYFAKRFSAKEAFSKAIGLGMGRGINFNDVEILNDVMGKPYIQLSKSAIDFLEKYYKMSIDEIDIHTSVSDDYPVAQAIVILAKK